MNTSHIRSLFLTYFEERGHTSVPSASLIPLRDPTLLFTSAGMVPFKPYFIGSLKPPSSRLVSCQKSFRTSDIDEVGDISHMTFFEMLGNFSFGDYFKENAIAFAWEFLNERLEIPKERLAITVYDDDHDSYNFWRTISGQPEDRIFRYPKTENWWGPAGDEGPCGPCSEIHYDWGEGEGCGTVNCHPNHGCGRYVELWNLVFMQFYQARDKSLTNLPAPSIDTGLGLERIAAILQGVRDVYLTDILQTIIRRIADFNNVRYGQDSGVDFALRVVAEHMRASAFLIADGVVPGNEGRSYVLRRIMRRAMFYHHRYLNPKKIIISEIVDSIIIHMGETYPELSKNRLTIGEIISEEERSFRKTLTRGSLVIQKGLFELSSKTINLLSHVRYEQDLIKVIGELSKTKLPMPDNVRDSFIRPIVDIYESLIISNKIAEVVESLVKQANVLSGETMFILYDTYGFPAQLTREIAVSNGMTVDMAGFGGEMEKQRERGRSSKTFSGGMAIPTYERISNHVTKFVGYDHIIYETTIKGVLVGGVNNGHAVKGDKIDVVLGNTPFYAESGGQIGDSGRIVAPNGWVSVSDTQMPVEGLVIHTGIVEDGYISIDDDVTAEVNFRSRADISLNHSGTHLLHASLRTVLGNHVRQAGSLVSQSRLRFDFTHTQALSEDDILCIQAMVNDHILANLPITTQQTNYPDALEQGALAFFGDQYAGEVRVVKMGNEHPVSLELCGGTHVETTSQLGMLFITQESGIGGGIRRIEALTGRTAHEFMISQSNLVEKLSRRFETSRNELEARLESVLGDIGQLNRQNESLRADALKSELQNLISKTQEISGLTLLSSTTSANSIKSLRDMTDWAKLKLPNSVIALGALISNSPIIIVAIGPELITKGLNARDIAASLAKILGGGGGGKPGLAQAGGKSPEKLGAALDALPEILTSFVHR